MTSLFGFAIVVIVIWVALSGSASASASARWQALAASGTPARGILLAVASTSSRVRLRQYGFPLERRAVTIDIEVPGQAPYEARIAVAYPVNMRGDVLPGATVELRIDPKNRANVAIVGPGAGYAFASSAPPPLPTRSA